MFLQLYTIITKLNTMFLKLCDSFKIVIVTDIIPTR